MDSLHPRPLYHGKVVPVAGVIGVIILLAFFTGCASQQERIQVAAASSVASVMDELSAAYAEETGVHVVPVLGSSGKLAQQITNGAPYDVFMSANAAYVDQLIADGALLSDTRTVYALGVLVIATPREAPFAVTELADLTDKRIARIAIANPRLAPYGLAAQQALQRSGLWERVADKLVIAETVRQATQFLETGNVDAAFIALSTADTAKVRVLTVDPALYDPLLHEAAVVTRTAHPEEARSFIAFLQGPTAQAIFRRHGFRTPH